MKLLRRFGIGPVGPDEYPPVERVDTCIYPWTTIGVDEHGGVRVCGYPRRNIGTLGSEGVDAVWNGVIAQQLRWFMHRGLIHPVCHGAQCTFVRNTLKKGEPPGLRDAVEEQLDGADYLRRHPDVAAAIERGEFPNALAHYKAFGRQEGRLATFHLDRVTVPVTAVPVLEEKCQRHLNRSGGSGDWVESFDEAYYLRKNTDAENQVRRGVFSSGLEHYLMAGGLETKRPVRLQRRVPDSEWSLGADVRAMRAFVTGETKVPVPPIFLVLTLTTRCNLRCVMCPHGAGHVTKPCDAPVEHLDFIRDAIPGIQRVELVGVGEPLLAPLFAKAIAKWPFRKGCYVRANSNGQLITPEAGERLIRSGLRELSISLDAARKETYELIRGGDFDRLLANIRNLVISKRAAGDIGPEIWINMIVMQLNAEQCVEFIRLALELHVDGVELSLLARFGDRPDWVVERKGFVFRYQDQMLSHFIPVARENIRKALELAKARGLQVRTRMYSDEREVLGIYEGLV